MHSSDRSWSFWPCGLMFSSPFQVEAARPNSPTNLVGRVTSNSVNLYWVAPDSGDEPTDYRIFRRDNKTNPTGAFEILGLLNGRDGPPMSFRDSNQHGRQPGLSSTLSPPSTTTG